MKRLLWLFVAVPAAILLIVFSVANRAPVTMLLDPFSKDDPAIALTLPFFVFLFSALILGMLVGGTLVWIGQGHHRKAARLSAAEALRWRKDAEAQKNRADTLAMGAAAAAVTALPVPDSKAA
jgi:uncharacterized integral membrane protein